jgi:hypothetical protein
MFRTATATLICLLAVSPAFALPPKVAVSGKPMIVWEGYAINPDCTTMGQMTFRLTRPAHGQVSLQKAKVFPHFPPSNPRNICNNRTVPGQRATYTSTANYTGRDGFSYDVIGPAGREWTETVDVVVK